MDKLSQLLGDEDPYKDFKAAHSAMDEKSIEFQRLCFEIFHMSLDGKKLYQIILDNFIIPSKFLPTESNATTMAIYWAGFKDALRGLYDHGSKHQQHINEGKLR